MKPVVENVKFQTVHPDPDNRQGYLHLDAGVASQGFIRGSNLDVGQVIMFFSKNGKKAWVGWLTEYFNDSYGPGWFWTVQCAKNVADPDETGTEVTVVVVDPGSPTTPSDPKIPVPNPDDVP